MLANLVCASTMLLQISVLSTDVVYVPYTVTWDEPIGLVDGSKLNGVAYFSVLYDIGEGPIVAKKVESKFTTIGIVEHIVNFSVPVKKFGLSKVLIWLEASDSDGVLLSKGDFVFGEYFNGIYIERNQDN